MNVKKQLSEIAMMPYGHHLNTLGMLFAIGIVVILLAERMGHDAHWLNTAISVVIGYSLTLAVAMWAKRSCEKNETKLSFTPSSNGHHGGWLCQADLEHHKAFFGTGSFPGGRKTPNPIEVLTLAGVFGVVPADYLDRFPPESQWYHQIKAYQLTLLPVKSKGTQHLKERT
jgi:hypothetical protein